MAIIVFWAKKINTDNDISNREDRFVPLIVGIVSYFIGFIVCLIFNASNFLALLLLSLKFENTSTSASRG
ncbi:MAG: hypothetical protein E7Z81_05820 [Methanobrevibacter sp.]|uniref:hypothetical protein n=1 Tax=Methanobrevibacter sp. TaxID=66852 RepID=UPI0025DB6376|nr:hypothetical protein [Methanobrevibacter sp.]MBE6497777.1 hypothetical protein [Methanobrevibacter sp.]